MNKSNAEIIQEWGPFQGAETVHGVTYDGHTVWVAAGSKLITVDPASGKTGRSINVTADAGTAFDGQYLYQLAEAEIRKQVSCQVAALPVPYRTTEEHATFFSFTDPAYDAVPGGRPFPTALEPFLCNRYEMADFARHAHDLGIRYLGICCGNSPAHTRAIAEALGRHPPASRYSPDMSKHFAFGTDPSLDPETLEIAPRL